jgi:3-oxoacyl-[acyl-carrier protein] reductase
MMERKFRRVINITSSAVKAPNQLLGLSNGARADLTGFIAGIARKTVANNVTINAVLPGAFDTDRLRSNFKYVAEKTGKSVDEVAAARAAENPAKRLGQAYEFGELCAFLCSDQASFITGQNILIDGGNYPGTL